MRRLAFAATVLIAAPLLTASAQQNPNYIVPTAPPGTSDNRAASTEFVANSISVPTSLYFSPSAVTAGVMNSLYLASANVLGLKEGGTNLIAQVPVTSISDPNVAAATGAMLPRLNENWKLSGNEIFIDSFDQSIGPLVFTVGGTWLAGDIARVNVSYAGPVTRTFSHTVVGGGTSTATIATALRTLMLADTTFTAAQFYPQAAGSPSIQFTSVYANVPVTISNTGTTSASGTITFPSGTTMPTVLDGPLGYKCMRRVPGRAPQAEDYICGVHFWGQLNSASPTPSADEVGRIDAYWDTPGSYSRFQFGTYETSATVNRLFIRRGLSLAKDTGGFPNGGTNGDMGPGTLNSPDISAANSGFWTDGKGYLRYRATAGAVQLNTVGAVPLDFGANEIRAMRLAADNLSFFPAADNATSLGAVGSRWSVGYFANLTANGVALGGANGALTTSLALTDGQVIVGQTGNPPLPKTLSGDCALAASGAITCTTVNGVRRASGETALDGSNPTPITTGLTSITSCTATIKTTTAPGLGTSIVTYGSSAGTLNLYGWKVTAANDNTLIASTGTDTIGWQCTGT